MACCLAGMLSTARQHWAAMHLRPELHTAVPDLSSQVASRGH